MIPWSHLAASPIPGGEGTIRLLRRGAELSIRLGQNELMNSRLSGSEVALAVQTLQRLTDTSRAKILIGGLGMGFTLRAALAKLGPGAGVTVAELIPAVVAWARGPMAELFGDSLVDPRVAILEGDVGALMRTSVGAYDAILLDVDNGPEGLTRAGNDALYGARGLAAAKRALRPGGLLAVWSMGPDAAFAARMRGAGFAVDEIRVRANAGKRGARHVIWIGRRD